MLARKRRFAANVLRSAQNQSLDTVSPTATGVMKTVFDGSGPLGSVRNRALRSRSRAVLVRLRA